MGNQNIEKNQKFRKEDWQAVQKLPDCQIWRNRREPIFRIEYSNEVQMKQQRRMFDLRRKSPILVAAYYCEYRPNDDFCSNYYRHSLYLQRIPIRLSDVQHIPYPDYLHLYDSCLKGFAQLAKNNGYFLVDENMIGINEQSRVKVWLNEDYSKSNPLHGKVTEENMVRSIVETIERNIDLQQTPSQIPSVRNFLYKNADSLNFDTILWQFSQFTNKFNSGNVPVKLDCIDRVGGIYAIVNRQRNILNDEEIQQPNKKIDSKLSEISQNQFKISQFNLGNAKKINGFQYNSNVAKLSKNQQEILQSPRQSNNSPKIQFIHRSSSPILSNLRINSSPITRQISPFRNGINIVIPPNHSTILSSPRNIQQNSAFIRDRSPPQQYLRNHQVYSPNLNIPKQVTAVSSNQQINQNYRSPIPQKNIVLNQAIPINSQINYQNNIPYRTSMITKSNNYTHRPLKPSLGINSAQPNPASKNNAIKFTVQVIPGKVYPQKSSTIFNKQTIINNGQAKPTISLQQHNAKITLQKIVQNQSAIKKFQQQIKDAEIKDLNEKIDQKVYLPNIQQPIQQRQVKIQQNLKTNMNQALVDYHEQTQIINQIPSKNENKQIFSKISSNFDDYSNKITVSSSYEVDQKYIKPSNMIGNDIIPQQSYIGSQQVPEQRISFWTAGSQQNKQKQQLQKKLLCSFNPVFHENFTTNKREIQNGLYQCKENIFKEEKHKDFDVNNTPAQRQSQDYNLQSMANYGTNKYEYSQVPQVPEILKYERIYQVENIRETGKFNYQDMNKYDQQVYSDEVNNRQKINDYEVNKMQQKEQYGSPSHSYNQNNFHYENYKYSNISKDYSHVDQNDGKSSVDFMKKLNDINHVQLSSGYNIPSSAYDIPSSGYNIYSSSYNTHSSTYNIPVRADDQQSRGQQINFYKHSDYLHDLANNHDLGEKFVSNEHLQAFGTGSSNNFRGYQHYEYLQ